ncbi:Mn2+ and Fe2+ transporters of the NRAMP family [Georgenia satyanarayanai]|uniref:Mn2+ and Fe2+ transporters of the NRAMP family n=1 Tax=Georgenia satyanarayanai TaxID=860221 RepID=A0A2Y9AIJ3_9MICO|nr:Nramp family divalent metal transporter [Georgenia satyanarayanai]PYF99013.1 Mn2+/Fe2+ NRAMP family transporter [Georgenia satyanarayanai]SSA43975.1 Mn2+ and Fe2+ transporters of the NRAMP family [Georgenia satyanarayanai]
MADRPEASVAVGDPYRLDPDGVREPPTTWRGSLRFFGPGLIVSASIVGAGELITATALGAEAGFVLLWLVVFSTLVKVAVQVEMARYSIVTGLGGMEGYTRVPPRVGNIGWVLVMWALMAISKLIQTGGLIGGMAAALSILLPIGSGPLEATSLTIWAVVVTVLAVVTLYSNRYGLIEKVAVFLTMTFVVVTLVIALGLPATEYAYSAGDLASGLSLSLPAGAIGVAVAMFGLTGVGSEEITAYTYWCLEKGYARWSGPNDGSADYRRRARGWIAVMQRDALAAWVIYTISTMSFYVMGAAVLHPQGLAPEGNDMIEVLSETYASVLGDWGRVLYLVGALAALGSTIWAAVPSWSRSWANAMSIVGVYDWTDARRRNGWMRFFIVALPVVWLLTYLWISSPFIMILIGGVAGGIFLAAVAVAAWYLRARYVEPELRGGRFSATALAVSGVAILLLGVYSALSATGLVSV